MVLGVNAAHCVTMNEEEEVTTLLNDYYALNDRAIPYEPPHRRAKYPRSDNSLLPYIGPTGQGWPNDKIPPEIFEAIGRYLPRECLRNFRLSCKEFERKISHGFFTTVVVPFRPELFGGVEASHPIKPEPEGKGKAVARLEPMNENGVIFDGKHHFSCGGKAGKGDDHNGMNVFKAWGHHINKFGMSFEIHEGKQVIPHSIQTFCSFRLGLSLDFVKALGQFDPSGTWRGS